MERSPTRVAVAAAAGVFIHPALRPGRVLDLLAHLLVLAVLIFVGEEAEEARGAVVLGWRDTLKHPMLISFDPAHKNMQLGTPCPR
jgi:hypothetical protein